MLPLNLLAARVRPVSESHLPSTAAPTLGHPSLSQSRQYIQAGSSARTGKSYNQCAAALPSWGRMLHTGIVYASQTWVIVSKCRSTQQLVMCWPSYGTCAFRFSEKDFVCVLKFGSTQQPVDELAFLRYLPPSPEKLFDRKSRYARLGMLQNVVLTFPLSELLKKFTNSIGVCKPAHASSHCLIFQCVQLEFFIC